MTAEQSIRNIEHLMDAVNAAARNTPKPDPRADLVDLFEARAETHDDKSWIEVEEAVDLVMDREGEGEVEWARRAIRNGQIVDQHGHATGVEDNLFDSKPDCGDGGFHLPVMRTVYRGPWIEVQP